MEEPGRSRGPARAGRFRKPDQIVPPHSQARGPVLDPMHRETDRVPVEGDRALQVRDGEVHPADRGARVDPSGVHGRDSTLVV